MSPELTGALATILDSARAEAKRFDHPRTLPLHVAAALARRDPAQFAEDFGEDAPDRLRSALAHLRLGEVDRGVEPATIELINTVGSAPDPWRAIAAALHDTMTALDPLPSADDEPSAGHGAPTDHQASAGHEASTGDQASAGHEAPIDHGTEGGRDAAPPTEGPDGSTTVGDRDAAGDFAAKIPARSRSIVTVLSPDDTLLERTGVVDRLLEILGRHSPGAPCVVGEPGAGRTALLQLLAGRLAAGPAPASLAGRPVVRVSPGAILAADRSNALRKVLDDVGPEAILAIDDLEVLGALGSPSVDADMLGVIRAAVERPGGAIVTMAASYLGKLDIHNHELLEELTVVELPPLAGDGLATLIEQRSATLAAFHGVAITADACRRAAAPPSPGDLRVQPGLGVDRLDDACARAQGRGGAEVTGDDVHLGARADRAGRLDREALTELLRARVKGQDHAVDSVVHRLALTRADLDLNPERPDGVFLFAGPTGVGKTALAQALSEALSGSRDQLIRLDMSEYSDEWAVSRLTGPQPGYVGYTEPEGWLTTKVRERPDAVVLLDEIEKAHPTVWNTFLQVFDAGRLTDARGNVARFAETVVVMTSNIGSEAFSASSVGFLETRPDAAASEAAVIRSIESTMAPELVNRLDQVIVFQPLTEASIAAIAAGEIAATLERLRGLGYEVTIGPDVVALVAQTGYDARYGARHVQRSIEQLLLQPLVAHAPGKLTASIADGSITWTAGG